MLRSVSATVEHAQIIALIGPNGAGKSTLIDVLAGRLQGYAGTCRMGGMDIRAMNRLEHCRQAAHVPQRRIDNVQFSVEEVILTGRTPHSKGLYETDDDFDALESALELTGLAPFRDRLFSGLSGGEQQRVLVAAAVAQESPILLLDEPGSHLDPKNQIELWRLLERLRDQGRLILIVTHHLQLAARRSDRVWVLSEGHLVADGTPAEAMRPERLDEVFQASFERHTSEDGRVFLNYG